MESLRGSASIEALLYVGACTDRGTFGVIGKVGIVLSAVDTFLRTYMFSIEAQATL